MKYDKALTLAKDLASETGELWYVYNDVGSYGVRSLFTYEKPSPVELVARVWPDGRVDSFSFHTEYPLSHYTE